MEAIDTRSQWNRIIWIAYWTTLVLLLISGPVSALLHDILSILHGTCLIATLLFVAQDIPKWVYLLSLFGVYLIATGVSDILAPFL